MCEFKRTNINLVVVHGFNSSTQETEAEGLKVSLGYIVRTILQNNKPKQQNYHKFFQG